MQITLADLRAAGLTEAQILQVIEAADTRQTEKRRAQNREASRTYRRQQNQQLIADAADAADAPNKKEKVPKRKNSFSLRSKGGAAPPSDPEKTALYHRGKQILGPSAGGQITRLLNCKGTVAAARAILEMAAGAGNPAEYVGAVIRGRVPTAEQDEGRLLLEWCRKNGVSSCEAREIPFILEDMNGGQPYIRPRPTDRNDPRISPAGGA